MYFFSRITSVEHTLILFFLSVCVFLVASVKFLGDSQPTNRKALAVYPIGLFYFVIGWMIISHSG